jgi:hypothetical protein
MITQKLITRKEFHEMMDCSLDFFYSALNKPRTVHPGNSDFIWEIKAGLEAQTLEREIAAINFEFAAHRAWRD